MYNVGSLDFQIHVLAPNNLKKDRYQKVYKLLPQKFTFSQIVPLFRVVGITPRLWNVELLAQRVPTEAKDERRRIDGEVEVLRRSGI